MRRLVVACALLLPSFAAAQDAGVVELTPTIGWRRGGSVTVNDRAFQNRDVTVDLLSQGSFGLRLGFDLSRRLQLEFLLDRQNGQLTDDKSLFGEQPGGFVPIGDYHLLDFNVTYYHVGLNWQLTPGPNRWYIGLSAGDTRLEPKVPLPSKDAFSASVAAGLKVALSEHSALRFEGRFFWTDTSRLPSAVQSFGNNRDCYIGGPCTYTYRYRDALYQTELSLGYVIRF